MAFEKIAGFFSNSCETCDEPKIKNKKMLVTHYYVGNYEKVKAAVSNVCQNELELILMNVDDHYKELLFENKKESLIVTIASVSANESSVDVKVKLNRSIGFNKPQKILDMFYNSLNRKLILKRIGGTKDE